MKIKEIVVEQTLAKSLEDILKTVGSAQRGEPESVMLVVQRLMGGGVLNPVVEHIGDLTHRMCLGKRQYAGYEFVKEKVVRGIRYFTSGYGFEREFKENIASNARYNKIDEEVLRDKIYTALEKYAAAHSKIPVFNEAQKVARQAAIDIGNRDWNSSLKNLRILDQHLNSPQEWLEYAHNGLD